MLVVVRLLIQIDRNQCERQSTMVSMEEEEEEEEEKWIG